MKYIMNNISRTNKVAGINLCFVNASNNQITEMYNMFVKDIVCRDAKLMIRRKMIEHVVKNMHLADDATINDMYGYAVDNKLMDGNQQHVVPHAVPYAMQPVKKPEVKDDGKDYEIIFTVVNDLLEAMGKAKIENLEDFKDIRREELVQDTCKQVIERNKEMIFKKFRKAEIRYYQKDKLRTFVITALRAMVSRLDAYKFVSKNHKNKPIVKKNDKSNYTCYSIKKVDA